MRGKHRSLLAAILVLAIGLVIVAMYWQAGNLIEASAPALNAGDK